MGRPWRVGEGCPAERGCWIKSDCNQIPPRGLRIEIKRRLFHPLGRRIKSDYKQNPPRSLRIETRWRLFHPLGRRINSDYKQNPPRSLRIETRWRLFHPLGRRINSDYKQIPLRGLRTETHEWLHPAICWGNKLRRRPFSGSYLRVKIRCKRRVKGCLLR